MIQLIHFSCDHGLEQIQADDMMVRPQQQPVLGGASIAWFTHVPFATRENLGLTSHTLQCDRMSHRLHAIAGDTLFRWDQVRHAFPRSGVLRLEAARGARPAFWWVSTDPVSVEQIS